MENRNIQLADIDFNYIKTLSDEYLTGTELVEHYSMFSVGADDEYEGNTLGYDLNDIEITALGFLFYNKMKNYSFNIITYEYIDDYFSKNYYLGILYYVNYLISFLEKKREETLVLDPCVVTNTQFVYVKQDETNLNEIKEINKGSKFDFNLDYFNTYKLIDKDKHTQIELKEILNKLDKTFSSEDKKYMNDLLNVTVNRDQNKYSLSEMPIEIPMFLIRMKILFEKTKTTLCELIEKKYNGTLGNLENMIDDLIFYKIDIRDKILYKYISNIFYNDETSRGLSNFNFLNRYNIDYFLQNNNIFNDSYFCFTIPTTPKIPDHYLIQEEKLIQQTKLAGLVRYVKPLMTHIIHPFVDPFQKNQNGYIHFLRVNMPNVDEWGDMNDLAVIMTEGQLTSVSNVVSSNVADLVTWTWDPSYGINGKPTDLVMIGTHHYNGSLWYWLSAPVERWVGTASITALHHINQRSFSVIITYSENTSGRLLMVSNSVMVELVPA